MRIISADSAAAILDDRFNPISLVASVAVLVESPYREANLRISEPIFKEINDDFDVIVHEAELCQDLLETVQADVVHLDATLSGICIEELSPVELANMKVSAKARTKLLKILPQLRRIAGEIRRKHSIEMLAMGKESIVVRIAELTTGAEAILYACLKAIKENRSLLLGLPIKCQHFIVDDRIYLYSLMEAEHDVRGYAKDTEKVLSKVDIIEWPNPIARGFRTLKIKPLD